LHRSFGPTRPFGQHLGGCHHCVGGKGKDGVLKLQDSQCPTPRQPTNPYGKQQHVVATLGCVVTTSVVICMDILLTLNKG
jgi:hypothetical protein